MSILAVLVCLSGCTTVSHTTHAAVPSIITHEKGAFLDAQTFDIVDYLPPPPADDSAQTMGELKAVLAIQKTRTLQDVARVQADVVENIWRFKDVVKNPKFSKENLPKLDAFIDRVAQTEGAVTDPAKAKWHRLRPFQVSPLVKPAVKLSMSGSWPSGHATMGTMMGIILAKMIPEMRPEIMARAQEFAHNRVVAGVHFPSDVEAGKISGTAVTAVLFTRPDFQNEFAAAKAELRSVLELK